jgi:N-acetylglucosamine-6-phosphate deacetylase
VTPVLTPGLVDLQVNGVGDIDLVHADPDGWAAVGRTLLAHGVTAYCPTFVTAPLDAYAPALERAAAAQVAAAGAGDQAAIIGVHLEGPFLGSAPGAHRAELVRPADTGWLDRLLAAHRGLVRLVTLAPEADPGLDAIRLLVAAGVVIALGHSRASYDDVMAAVDAGASVVTHVFNAMEPLRAREPGLVGAALSDPRLTSTVIADLVHVHPAAVRIALGAPGGTVIVSDSVACVGDVRARDGAARLPGGELAGATTLLDGALRNLVRSGVEREVALHAVTTRPAQLLGVVDRGEDGGRVALDPDTFEVQAVWLRGEQVASRPGAGQ